MKFIETKISDVIIIGPTVFGDARGYFLESCNQKKFEEGIDKTVKWYSDNEDWLNNILTGKYNQYN